MIFADHVRFEHMHTHLKDASFRHTRVAQATQAGMEQEAAVTAALDQRRDSLSGRALRGTSLLQAPPCSLCPRR
jgi:hypothetical protein